jgi:hypothetical protein
VGIVPVLPIFPPKILVAFQPIAPDGYVPLGQATAIWVPTNAQARRLGAIGQGDPYTFVHGLSSELIGGLADPPLDALVCLRFDYAAQGAFGPLIWMGRTIPPAAGYLVAKTNVTYTQLGEVPPVGPIYIPKSIVLDNK